MLKQRCIKEQTMKRFRYCSVILPVTNMMSWWSLFTLTRFCLLVILLTGSLVQTKEITTRKLHQPKMSKKSNSKLGGTSSKVDTFDDKTFKEAVCVSTWINNYLKGISIKTKIPLPLTKKELGELIRDIVDVLSGKNMNSQNLHTEKNYELIKIKLESFGYLSKPTVYAPEHELYNQMWNAFTWRDPLKGFASPKDAQKIIRVLDDSLLSSSKLTWSDFEVLFKFFQKQPLYFDNNNPQMDKFPTSPAATYKFLRNFKIPESLQNLMPRSMSVVEAIEDAQNMLSFESSSWQYRLRHLNITTLNLEKCSTSGGTVPPPTVSPSIICGDPVTQWKIVGGAVSKKGAWPWMALLVLDKNIPVETAPLCGGSLISDKYILTAAHCVVHYPPVNVRVYLGENDRNRFYDSSTLLVRDAERHFVHESYDLARNEEHDIALIKLKVKVPFNNYIRPICLPPPDINLVGKNGHIAGWGNIDNLDEYQYEFQPLVNRPTGNPQLLEAVLPIWENRDCQEVLGYYAISPQHLCAGRIEGGIDTCQGDSGGPIMYKPASGRWMAVGVVSWGIKCAKPNSPGVYTRVSSYLDWISPKLLL